MRVRARIPPPPVIVFVAAPHCPARDTHTHTTRHAHDPTNHLTCHRRTDGDLAHLRLASPPVLRQSAKQRRESSLIFFLSLFVFIVCSLTLVCRCVSADIVDATLSSLSLSLQGKLKALLNLNFSKKFVGEHFQPTYDWHAARYALALYIYIYINCLYLYYCELSSGVE